MIAMTGTSRLAMNFLIRSYMMSLAVTPPPGELMRITTALMAGSAWARSSFSTNMLVGFSPDPNSPPDRLLVISPSRSSSRTLSVTNRPGSRVTVVSLSFSSTGAGLMIHPPDRHPPARQAVARTAAIANRFVVFMPCPVLSM